MLTENAVTVFLTRKSLAEALGIRPSAVSQWGDLVPPHQARRLHELTNGKLVYDPANYSGHYPAYRYLPPAIEAA
jgi:hypothetical protein